MPTAATPTIAGADGRERSDDGTHSRQTLYRMWTPSANGDGELIGKCITIASNAYRSLPFVWASQCVYVQNDESRIDAACRADVDIVDGRR